MSRKASSVRDLDGVFSRLSRRTTSGRYIPEVDGFRFFCIGLILLFHVQLMAGLAVGNGREARPFGEVFFADWGNGWLSNLLAQGQIGVHLFFMISGFVLALPFVSRSLADGSPVDVRRYYLRRLTRLEPPYILAVGISFLLAAITFGADRSLLPDVAAGLSYAHGLVNGTANPVNGAFWSLEVEVQFYLLVPALAVLFKIRNSSTRRRTIVLASLLVIGAQLFLNSRYVVPPLSLLSYLQFFLVGFLVADLYVVGWEGKPRLDPRWDIVSLVGWPALLLGSSFGGVTQFVVLPWLGLALLCAAFRGPLTRRILRNRWLTTVGGMCYSIYLLHYPLMLSFGHFARSLLDGSAPLRVIVQFGVVLPMTVAAGLVFFVLIERPCMERDWPARLFAHVRRLARWRAGSAHAELDVLT